MRRALGLGVVLAVFQQWCGINVLFNYAENIFKNAGFNVNMVLLVIVITGVVDMAFTFVALAAFATEFLPQRAAWSKSPTAEQDS